ncbi:MAG: CRISPR-associated endonuclease Cas6 [Saprospiraceae bacterium]
MSPLPLTTLHLNIPLRHSGIYSFRGLVAEIIGWEEDLFHNHDNSPSSENGSRQSMNRYKHRYPLIQYKVRKGKAAILGMGEGAVKLRTLIDADGLIFGGKFPILERRDENFQMGMTDHPQHYRLRHWLPLNASNHERWQELREEDDLAPKRLELERILTAHLLAFAQGAKFEVPRPRGLEVRLEKFYGPEQVRSFGRSILLAFDAKFSANMTVPAGAGIGKASSIGFGQVWPSRGPKVPDLAGADGKAHNVL